METREILLLILLFLCCFFITEFLVDHLLLDNPFQRFIARVGFQILFYGFVYLLFDSRDISRRIKKMEKLLIEKTTGDDKNSSSKAEGC